MSKDKQHADIDAAFDRVEKVVASIDPILVEQMGPRLVGPRAVAHAFVDEHVPFEENDSLIGSAAWIKKHPEGAALWAQVEA